MAVAAAVALAAVAIGCGSDDEGPGNPESRAVDYEQALAV